MPNSCTALRIRVNGADHDVSAEPDTPLLYVLRNELSLNGPKFSGGDRERDLRCNGRSSPIGDIRAGART